MLMQPPPLKKGDKIAIVCPASRLPSSIEPAIAIFESWGLSVVIGSTVYASFYQFAGSDEQRTHDFQVFLDDPSIKAIIAARGGYGSIRIIDKLDFSTFIKQPKWIVGFSDITVFHSHIHANFGIPTIHGAMPVTLPKATELALETLRKSLFGEAIEYHIPNSACNQYGEAKGILVGGNLTSLISACGSVSEMDFDNKILFLEEVDEYLYSIDRMVWHLKRAGKLSKLKGLIIGAFSEIKDNETPFGKNYMEIIADQVQEHALPVCFNFPAGHIADNQALVFGREIMLKVCTEGGMLVSCA